MQLIKIKPKNFFLYLCASIGNLLAFEGGVAFTWCSSMLPKLNGSVDPESNPLSRPATLLEESWIAALVALGSIFGPPLFGYSADKFGRKKTLLILACPMFLSLLMMAFAKSVTIFLIARFITGMSAGSVWTVIPMYLVEIAEVHNRGTLSIFMSVFSSSGGLFTYAIGPFLSVQNFCLMCLIPLVVFFPACILLSPESPYFLASVKNEAALRTTLLKLRRNKKVEEVDSEVMEITKIVEELKQNKSGLKDLCTSKAYRKGLTISLGLITIQQLAGIAAVMSYLQTIFDTAKTGLSPQISASIVGLIQLCVAVVVSALVDISGRKILLLTSTTGSFISLTSLGVFFFLKNHGFEVSQISWLPVVSVVLFNISFSCGIGPLPWIVNAEIFPPSVRATAASLMAIVCFVGNFTITLCFPHLSFALGMEYTFWIFAAASLFGTVFIYCILPETKGRSLREIQKLLNP